MAGDSCYLVKKHEGLVLEQNVCVCLCVSCSVGFWYGGSLLMYLRVCWAHESSVQSQQWLGVLAFPLVFMFQRAGFHHRLGPESKKTCKCFQNI